MRVLKNLQLKNYSSYRTPGTTELAVFPENAGDLEKIFNTFPDCIIIGQGSNVLFSPVAIKKPLVFTGHLDKCTVSGEKIYAQAGTPVKKILEIALHHGLGGM